METNVIWRNARAAVIELDDGGYFTCADTWEIFVNDEPVGTTNTVETYVDGLVPGKRNLVRFVCGERELSVGVTTPAEPFTINVRDCGAKGDAEHDDTTNIQAAIMACPKDGRVLIPAGSYRIKSLFLKSNINIELAEGAVLLARHDRAALAYIPGTVTGDEGAGYAGTDMLPLGRWEGESFSTYCSTFTGLSVHDVCIYGRGAIDGQTDFAEDNWWNKDFKNIFRPEEGREVARPRMIFLSECQNVSLAGFTVRNSPAWNIHPILCEHVDALCLSIEGPKNSHNTDGFDPESCGFVRILGCQFSVGDDCIAIKSGKLGIEPELRPATHDVLISHCYMHDGHGAVVLGSEAAGGIKDLTVSKCLFERTDRGLRVKTRRGRGQQGVIDDIVFENVRMEHVGTPYVVNCMYFCDPDGKSEYVQSREKQPVDERTPRIGTVAFRHVTATDVTCAGYFLGLPERPIEAVVMEDVHISCDKNAKPMQPAMAQGVPYLARKGLTAINVAKIVLKDVTITGQDGAKLECDGVGEVEK